MVRATAAEVLKLFGGSYPTGLDATSVGNLCDTADYQLDGFARGEGEPSLSTSDTAIISIANAIAARLCMHSLWMQAGGNLSNVPEPAIITPEIENRIKAIIRGGETYTIATAVDMVSDS